MGSREKDQRQPAVNNLSSLIVRAEDSGGGGSDYEPGEVRPDHHELPPYSRPQRFSDNPGYGMRAVSGSPLRQRKVDRHYDSDFGHPAGQRRGRGFRGGRGPERFREFSPPYGRGKGGRSFGRGFGRPEFSPEPFRGESITRNNPNVPPREGDWICSDPLCGNLNFARRAHCNNCNKLRIPTGSNSQRKRYLSPPPMGRGPGRNMNNSYRSPPPRYWSREAPRDFGMGPPPPRHGGRFPDRRHARRERPDFHEEDEYRGRGEFDRPMPLEWGNHRDRERDEFLLPERRGFDDRPMMPNHGRWPRESRERSRSPMRGGPKDFPRDSYAGRGRVDRRGMARGVY